LQENRCWQNHTLQIPHPSIQRTTNQINGLRIVQGGLITRACCRAVSPSKPLSVTTTVYFYFYWGCTGFGPIGLPGGVCKKTGARNTATCNSCAHQAEEHSTRSMTCGLRDCGFFRADDEALCNHPLP